MNFGKFDMKLRYGQVAMKILRYGPIGETRAESPAIGPANLIRYKKKERPKPPFICLDLQFPQLTQNPYENELRHYLHHKER